MPNSRYERNMPMNVAYCLLGSLDLSLFLRSYRQDTAKSRGSITSHHSDPLVCIRHISVPHGLKHNYCLLV